MLGKIASTGFSISRQFLQPSSKTNWIGRSITTLCEGCNTWCLNFIEAKSNNAICEKALKDRKVTVLSGETSDARSASKNPKEPLYPFPPFRKGLMQP